MELDAEVLGKFALAHLPRAALDELHDEDPPAPRLDATNHAEGRRGLAPAVPGLHEEALGLGHRLMPRSVGPNHPQARIAGPPNWPEFRLWSKVLGGSVLQLGSMVVKSGSFALR